MRVLALSTLRDYWESGHATAETPLRYWFAVTERASWSRFADIKQDFPATDWVGDKAIFNIGGNNYRFVAMVNFESKYVLVKWIGTHAEYDRLNLENLK